MNEQGISPMMEDTADMSLSLSDFLNADLVKDDKPHYFPASSLLKGKDGKPIPWELRPVTTPEYKAIRKAAQRKVPIPGKKGQYTVEFDDGEWQTKLCIAAVVQPDLQNAQLQDKYGVRNERQLFEIFMQLPGDFDDLLQEVMSISGYKDDVDLEEEVKNS